MSLDEIRQRAADGRLNFWHAAADRDRLIAAVDAILALAVAYDTRAVDATETDWQQCLVLAAAATDIRAAVTDALGGDQ